MVLICCWGKRASGEVRITEVNEVGLGPRELQKASAGQPTLSPSPRPPSGEEPRFSQGASLGAARAESCEPTLDVAALFPIPAQGSGGRTWVGRSRLTRVSSGPLSWPCARPLPGPHEGTPGPGEKPGTGSPRIEQCAPTTGRLGTESGEVWGRGWGPGRVPFTSTLGV